MSEEGFVEAESGEVLPASAQEQLARLTATANRMLESLEGAGATADTIKSMNLLRQLILANSEISLKVARTEALKSEKEVAMAIAQKDSVREIYGWLLRGLETPQGIERMRESLSWALAKGV